MHTHAYPRDERQKHPRQSADYAVDATFFYWPRRGFHEISAKSEFGSLVTPAWLVDPLNLPSMRSIVRFGADTTNFGPANLITEPGTEAT